MGLATVGLGQGTLASLGGWVATTPTFTAFGRLELAGILAVTLITVGFYPLTQMYQIEADRARDDQTFAAWAGADAAFRFSLAVQAIAAIGLVAVVWHMVSPAGALIVAGFYGVLLVAISRWAYTFGESSISDNYRRVMILHALTAIGFGVSSARNYSISYYHNAISFDPARVASISSACSGRLAAYARTSPKQPASIMSPCGTAR